MKPLDPRLLQHAHATRGFLLASVVIGTVSALLLVAQAFLIADAVTAAFQDGAGLGDVQSTLVALVAIAVARGVLAWASEAVGHRSAADATSQLRMQVVERALRLGPAFLGGRGVGELTTLVTRGAGALDTYFARYLPQLVLAVVVPLIATVVIATQDLLAAVIIALTVPIIPLFMVLIGQYTQSRVDRQWATLGVLSGHFLDVVAGLPTLKIFNRAKAQVATIRAVGDQYRASTMGVLRISFLSSLVLELLASLSVAIIAVSIGLRLVEGTMELSTGLAVLILAPEVYLPLRLVGQHFHAAADGVGAAERMFEVLEADAPAPGSQLVDAATATIRVRDLGVTFGDRVAVAGATFEILPGRVTAVVGPSGCGKSTILSVLLGLVGPPTATVSGVVEVQDGSSAAVGMADLDLPAWRSQIGWVPQSPAMLGATVADNVRFGRQGFTEGEVVRCPSRGRPRPRRAPERDLDRDHRGGRRGIGRAGPSHRRRPGPAGRPGDPAVRRADCRPRWDP